MVFHSLRLIRGSNSVQYAEQTLKSLYLRAFYVFTNNILCGIIYSSSLKHKENCMKVSTMKTSDDHMSHQLLIDVALGLHESIKVVCHSVDRDTTSYEIFDGSGEEMGQREFTAGHNGPIRGRFNSALVEDLNVLLDEFLVELTVEEFQGVSQQAINVCESRYGNGVKEGDCIITIQ